MTIGRLLSAAMRVRRTAKGPRKKRTRSDPRQYTELGQIEHHKNSDFVDVCKIVSWYKSTEPQGKTV
jgi:hypothetical protein